MAAVRAKPERESTNVDKVFTIALSDALSSLVASRHLTPPEGQTDQWFFALDGTNLRITRSRQTVTLTPDETD
jgi:hypothetical protein